MQEEKNRADPGTGRMNRISEILKTYSSKSTHIILIITFGIYGFWVGIKLKKWRISHTHTSALSGAESFFDGGLLQLIGYHILGALVTVLTLGICLPWAFTMIYNWETKHTVINGYRLRFDGTAVGLFGNWIKWLLLTIITFGIYGFWVHIKLKKWIVKHTYFVYR